MKARSIVSPADFVPTQKMKFTKTETEYNMKSIRFLLLTITSMFILIGVLMIVIGISVYSHYHSLSFFLTSVHNGGYQAPSVMSVFVGMILLVVTSFGFFGSLKKSTCMVNIYALLLSLILILKMVVVILAFTVDENTLYSYMNFPVWQYADDAEIQAEIDALQVSLNCCGSDSYQDYYEVNFTDNHHTVNYKTNSSWLELPVTCCRTSTVQTCVRLRRMGCKEALTNVVVQNSAIIGVLGISVMFIQMLGIIFALLLAHCIRKVKSEKALMAWKVKEQIILARQAEEATHKEAVYIKEIDHSVA